MNAQPAGPVQQPRHIACSDCVASSYIQASIVLLGTRQDAVPALVAGRAAGRQGDGYGHKEGLPVQLGRWSWQVPEWSGSYFGCLGVHKNSYQSRPAGVTSPLVLVATFFARRGETSAVSLGTDECHGAMRTWGKRCCVRVCSGLTPRSSGPSNTPLEIAARVHQRLCRLSFRPPSRDCSW